MTGAGPWHDLTRFGPHSGAHRVAIRAGVSVLVPLLVLWLIGHQEWSIYAAFGAFTSLYGRNHVGLTRLQMQLTLSVLLTVAVVLGVVVALSDHRAWLAVPITAAIAGAGSLVSDAQDWHPPGPLFLVFAFAACASIPSTPGDVTVAAVVVVSTAGFATVVGNIGAAVRSRGHRTEPFRRRGSYADVARRHVVRCVIGVLLAGTITTAAGIGHPYWAMVSAVVPLAAKAFGAQLVRGVHRIVGTAAGLGVTAVLLLFDLNGVLLILVIVALQVAAELLVGRNYAVALVVVTPLALLMVHMIAPTPPGVLLFDRGVETLIGAAVGIMIGWLTRPRPRPAPEPGPDPPVIATIGRPEHNGDMFFTRPTPTMVTATDALPGRETPVLQHPTFHEVFGTRLDQPPAGSDVAYVAMGCFWGAEKLFWQTEGVTLTAAGYMGGFTPNPTYEETCSGRTGHAEAVQVHFDPAKVSYADLLRIFWENHDPTQGLSQGNDVGSQYRSGLWTVGEEQAKVAQKSYDDAAKRFADASFGALTTTLDEAPEWFFAESVHQQYLDKNPNGYCPVHATGVTCG